MSEEKKLVEVEHIKARSRHLRGTIEEGLKNPVTGALSFDDTQLTKFHGFYQQDDRDLREERRHQKLEPLHTFMLRARVPGGVIKAEQWKAIDAISRELTGRGIRCHHLRVHHLQFRCQGYCDLLRHRHHQLQPMAYSLPHHLCRRLPYRHCYHRFQTCYLLLFRHYHL